MSVKVETGLSNENYIEIKETGALKEGDTVYIPQAIRATTNDFFAMAGMSGMTGQMPDFGGGQMPDFGGGSFSGGQRPSGNMGGSQRPGGTR